MDHLELSFEDKYGNSLTVLVLNTALYIYMSFEISISENNNREWTGFGEVYELFKRENYDLDMSG